MLALIGDREQLGRPEFGLLVGLFGAAGNENKGVALLAEQRAVQLEALLEDDGTLQIRIAASSHCGDP